MTSILSHFLSSTAYYRPTLGLTVAVVLFAWGRFVYRSMEQAAGTKAITEEKPFNAIQGAVQILLNSDQVIHSGRCRYPLAPT